MMIEEVFLALIETHLASFGRKMNIAVTLMVDMIYFCGSITFRYQCKRE